MVLYVSADEYVARQVIDAFEAEANVRVEFVGDTEAKKTTGLVDRLRSERDLPQADVFWSSEIFMTIGLANKGILAEHQSAVTESWPREYADPYGRWYGFAARARVIVYAPDRVAEADVPRSWMDLTQPRWHDRIVMADPRFGTTGGHLGAMKAYWDRHDRGAWSRFRSGLASNGMRMIPSGNAGVVQAVADGEADLGLTDTDDVWAYREQHGPVVSLVYARHGDPETPGTGTLLIPNTVARVAGGPNPEAAVLLIDFLLSPQVERMLAESVSHNVPLGSGRTPPDSKWAVPDPLDVDYRSAAAARADAVQEIMNLVPSDG